MSYTYVIARLAKHHSGVPRLQVLRDTFSAECVKTERLDYLEKFVYPAVAAYSGIYQWKGSRLHLVHVAEGCKASTPPRISVSPQWQRYLSGSRQPEIPCSIPKEVRQQIDDWKLRFSLERWPSRPEAGSPPKWATLLESRFFVFRSSRLLQCTYHPPLYDQSNEPKPILGLSISEYRLDDAADPSVTVTIPYQSGLGIRLMSASLYRSLITYAYPAFKPGLMDGYSWVAGCCDDVRDCSTIPVLACIYCHYRSLFADRGVRNLEAAIPKDMAIELRRDDSSLAPQSPSR